MARLITLAVIASLALTLSEAPAGPRKRPPPAGATGRLTVECPRSLKGPEFILVSLYHGGELVRTRELETLRVGIETMSVTWEELPCGTYAVCFEARGYARGVKRCRVSSEDGAGLVIHAELGDKPYQVGDGLRSGAGIDK